ncbi:MAG: winged helix DNA-binding domain-containing protein, partial [Anaerolineae bacterium]|nr:winged helix DNA-binding domain-containing protein [Anaerolineae bacterium]
RGGASTKEVLHAALYDQHSLAKVLCMRNTLFILPKPLLPIAYQATKPRRSALLGRYLHHYGISDEEYQRGCAAVDELLAGGARTTAEIKQELSDPAMAVMVDLMPEDWRIVRARPRGTWRSNQHEYVPFDDWFPDVDLHSLPVDEAQRRLVWHYLCCFGPASEEDVVWWTGLGKTEVRRALSEIADRLVQVDIDGLGGSYFLPANDLETLKGIQDDELGLWFLPSLDPCIMGYKDRSRFLRPSKYDKVFDPSGNALPTVWCDGQVVGIWMEDRKAQALQVLLFEPVALHLRDQLEEEAQGLSRFLEHHAPNVQIKPYPQDVYAKTPFSLGHRT